MDSQLKIFIMDSQLKIISANVHRISSKARGLELLDMIRKFDPTVVYFQEIGIGMALEVFKPYYHVYVNLDEECMGPERIGIAVSYTHLTLPTKRIV